MDIESDDVSDTWARYDNDWSTSRGNGWQYDYYVMRRRLLYPEHSGYSMHVRIRNMNLNKSEFLVYIDDERDTYNLFLGAVL